MFRSKIAKLMAAFALVAALGGTAVATSSTAEAAICSRGVGGSWYCL